MYWLIHIVSLSICTRVCLLVIELLHCWMTRNQTSHADVLSFCKCQSRIGLNPQSRHSPSLLGLDTCKRLSTIRFNPHLALPFPRVLRTPPQNRLFHFWRMSSSVSQDMTGIVSIMEYQHCGVSIHHDAGREWSRSAFPATTFISVTTQCWLLQGCVKLSFYLKSRKSASVLHQYTLYWWLLFAAMFGCALGTSSLWSVIPWCCLLSDVVDW